MPGSNSSDEPDFFRVDVSSAGTLTVYTTGNTDTYGYLLDASENSLVENDDNGSGNFRLAYPVSSGTYFIRVRHYSSSGTGPYTLNTEYTASDGPGVLAFSAANSSVGEAGGSVRIYVSRTGGSTGAASVDFATANGSASAGADYTEASSTLHWASGDTTDKYFDAPIVSDPNYEGNETFTVNLSGASGAALGSLSTATVIIVDDDTQTCTSSPSGLIHWWPGAGDANDVVGAAHGTLQNGASIAAGEVGNGFSFDGVDDYVSFGNSAGNFGTSEFTIEFWLRTASQNYVSSVLGKRPICGHSSFFDIRLTGATGRLGVEVDGDASGQPYLGLQTTRSVNDGVFHHVAVVRQGTYLALYIDGALEAQGAMSGVANLNNAADLVAGRSVCVGVDITSYLDGQLDEISLYHRALSLGEIQAIYGAGTAGKCATTPSPGTLAFKAATYSVGEAGPSVRIYVGRTGGSTGTASVNYATAGGSASAGVDYGVAVSTLSWANGDAADKSFYVSISDDANHEDNETFTVNLSGASGATLGSPASTTVTIVDDDTPPDPSPSPSVTLINVDFGFGTGPSGKVGFAATGETSEDFWNFYTRDDGSGGYRNSGTLSPLQAADGTTTDAGLTVVNAPGAWVANTTDPMYASYLYPWNGHITITVTDLPVGQYDFYVYSPNGSCSVNSGGVDYGVETSVDAGGGTPVWQEGVQYARFEGVTVASSGQPVVVTVLPATAGLATLSGMQIVGVGGAPCPAVTATATAIPPQCNGGTDGSITASASGGAAPYTYALNGGTFQAYATFGGLAAGSYTVTANDANGCIGETTVTVAQPSAVAVTATATAPQCYGGLDGSIVAAASGGTGQGYTYALGNGSFQSSGTFSGLAAGSYTIRARDSHNCEATTPVTIPQGSVVRILSQPLSQTVYSGDTVTFAAMACGQTPLNYQWQFNGANISGATEASLSFNSVQASAAGTYSVSVSSGGTTVSSANAELTVNTSTENAIQLTGTRQDVTLKSDTTYYVASAVTLLGTTTIEGGTVVKYAKSNGSSDPVKLVLQGPVVWRTGPYRPASFTAEDDNSVGARLSTYSGTPSASDYFNVIALEFPAIGNTSLEHVRIAYAGTAVYYHGAIAQEVRDTVRHAQIVNCGTAFETEGNGSYARVLNLGNVLLSGVTQAVTGSRFKGQVAHLTAANCNTLVTDTSSQNWAFTMVNSVLANVANLGGGVNLVASHHNGFYPSSNPGFGSDQWPTDVNPFQTSGGGHYYLAADSTHPFRRGGTTAIDASLSGLLNSLRVRTTQPPLVFPRYMNVTGELTLFPQIPRYDATSNPDLGYYYDALDYSVTAMHLYGGALTVLPGAAVAARNDCWFEYDEELEAWGEAATMWAFILFDGASFTCEGTASAPITFTTVELVQDGAPDQYGLRFARWPEQPARGELFEATGCAPEPALSFRFCNFSVPAVEYYHFVCGAN